MDASTHQATIGRFTAACQADARIVAAFLGGSYAAGRADEHSDLDLYLVVEDAAYDAFFAERRTFMEQLGTPARSRRAPSHWRYAPDAGRAVQSHPPNGSRRQNSLRASG